MRRSNIWLAFLLAAFLLAAAACAPSPEAAAQPTQQVIRILDLSSLPSVIEPAALAVEEETVPTSPPTDMPAFTPTATIKTQSTPAADPSDPQPTAACTNQAELVRILSGSDNIAVKTGNSFAKVWQIKNNGTCTWTTAYALVFVSGEIMDGPVSVLLPREVRPGETIDLRLTLKAPQGSSRIAFGSWMLQDGSGNRFGLGETGDSPLVVQIWVQHVIPPKPI
ncbi:MAG: hypothetical protein JXB15_03970 [Anaerolineales bacterium]|nr:hypothetical protein [Anaerolineales bacterium]